MRVVVVNSSSNLIPHKCDGGTTVCEKLHIDSIHFPLHLITSLTNGRHQIILIIGHRDSITFCCVMFTDGSYQIAFVPALSWLLCGLLRIVLTTVSYDVSFPPVVVALDVLQRHPV